MSGASIETKLEWASSLREVKRRMRPLFYAKAVKYQTWTRGLLIRRKIADGDLDFFTTWAPQETTIEKLAEVEGHR